MNSEEREQEYFSADWVVVILYILMLTFGAFTIYAATHRPEYSESFIDLNTHIGKHLFRIAGAILLILFLLKIPARWYESIAYFMYGLSIIQLIGIFWFGKEIGGSKSWFDFGIVQMQPSEFAKCTTALALSRLLRNSDESINTLQKYAGILLILFLPISLIICQKDMGTALIYGAFILALYREGLPNIFVIGIGSVLLLCIATFFLFKNYAFYLIGAIISIGLIYICFSAKKKRIFLLTLLSISLVFAFDSALKSILKEHQRKRIEVLINPSLDPLGYGYQTTQSKIAIGSGGLFGKGFLKGTQTKFEFIPEQSTDFIFCTICEEMGLVGSILLIGLFIILTLRLIHLAERQRSRFARMYGYSVASLLFTHFFINIGMTIGLLPVIGIPLPFFSYGGSSLWSFTILIFIFIRIDTCRYSSLSRLK